MRIRWLPLALANLDDEAAYIADDDHSGFGGGANIRHPRESH